MRTVTVTPGETIELGYQYDNDATTVIFPSSIINEFLDRYGFSGAFAIWYRRSGDSLGYPIGYPLVQLDSTNRITWLLTEAELANPGASQIQLRYIVDEVCVMSQIFNGIVSDSVDIGTDIPEPMEAWADAIIEAVENVHGIPNGGSSGQVLAKASDSNYDVEWVDQSGGGGGGSSTLAELSDTNISSPQNNQFLRYDSSTSKWENQSVTIPSAVSPYTSNPAALGASASPGSSSDYSRGDHVHAKPSPSDIGAIAAPSSPATGAFLMWNGSAWVASGLPTYNGGVS